MNVHEVQQREHLNRWNMMQIFDKRLFDGQCWNNYEILRLVLLMSYEDISSSNEVSENLSHI